MISKSTDAMTLYFSFYFGKQILSSVTRLFTVIVSILDEILLWYTVKL